MENVRTFFSGQNKDGTLTNNQRNGGLNPFTGRIVPAGIGSGLQGNMSPHSDGVDVKTHHEVKRKDSDSYFYIMWRS
ncbi:uncharacterized protein LOC129245810 isoform X2 [Anastrepha obliqua]|uniref:uncharacterized protein LOC128866985 n=1 Tax=Anastrepha ludens TaxID=28586 RepID=UPI0023B1A231|nr:uncharacterized protein LOC128866985 [Anastrepha ludens]XP_054740181.1 uncharacterized protein LOC129245810 isoform X1 [Anastrepha obliqua]XP_054740183.1 uncharacterized protein LOC129245810 isoform X2 [Anastrepha obliqua]